MKYGPLISQPFAGQLNPSELATFTEDRASRWAFERRFAPLTIPGLLSIAFAIVIGATGTRGPAIWLPLVVLGIAAVGTGIALMCRATPISRVSGQPMLRYRLTTPPEGADEEWIYLDTVSRTYFRITYYPSLSSN